MIVSNFLPSSLLRLHIVILSAKGHLFSLLKPSIRTHITVLSSFWSSPHRIREVCLCSLSWCTEKTNSHRKHWETRQHLSPREGDLARPFSYLPPRGLHSIFSAQIFVLLSDLKANTPWASPVPINGKLAYLQNAPCANKDWFYPGDTQAILNFPFPPLDAQEKSIARQKYFSWYAYKRLSHRPGFGLFPSYRATPNSNPQIFPFPIYSIPKISPVKKSSRYFKSRNTLFTLNYCKKQPTKST